MPDITLGAGRPYTLVTTVVHRGSTAPCKLAQTDIDRTSANLRIRFLNQASIARLHDALDDLALEAFFPDRLCHRRAIYTRVLTDHDAPAKQVQDRFMRRIFDRARYPPPLPKREEGRPSSRSLPLTSLTTEGIGAAHPSVTEALPPGILRGR